MKVHALSLHPCIARNTRSAIADNVIIGKVFRLVTSAKLETTPNQTFDQKIPVRIAKTAKKQSPEQSTAHQEKSVFYFEQTQSIEY